MGYSGAIATALRLIAAKGGACVWRKPGAHDSGAEDWRDVRSGSPDDHDVKIAWFRPRDLGYGRTEFLRSIPDTEIAEGFEVGLMAGGTDFEPELTDVVVRNSVPSEIGYLDRLAPDGTPVVWFVWVKI
jgi:hypothetical protein